MNKSLDEKGPYPFVQAYRSQMKKSKDIYEFFEIFGSQMKHI